MNHGSRLVFRSVVGLLLAIVGLTGCGSEETGAGPVAGGAGIPKNRGPVSSKMPKAGTSSVAGKPAGPASRRAAPAPTAEPTPAPAEAEKEQKP
jgi:hypothetical protein